MTVLAFVRLSTKCSLQNRSHNAASRTFLTFLLDTIPHDIILQIYSRDLRFGETTGKK